MSDEHKYISEQLRQLAVPITSLKPDVANARKHGEKNMEAIVASLDRWGQRLPIVVQREGMIVRAGNGRVEAAKRLGWTHIAAVVVDDSSVDAVAYAIADNRTAELAEWDTETLAALLKSLPEEDVGDTGFESEDINALLDQLTPPTETDWAKAMDALPDGDRAPIQQMSFTVSDDQAETIREAIKKAKSDGPFTDTGNANSNGNALARIASAYV